MRAEDKTQKAILQYLTAVHPTARSYTIKIKNEGKHSIAGHMTNKATGLHKYASDLFIAWPTLTHYGLWMEVKPDGWTKPRNKAERERVEGQLDFILKMKGVGYEGILVAGVDEGIEAINKYLNIKC